MAANLLDAGVENDEIVYHLQQPLLAAQLAQFPQQRVIPRGWVGFSFLPTQPVLLPRFNHAVAQPLGVVARHHELHRGKKRLDERLLLVVEILADTLGHRYRRTLQLQHAQGEAVDVEHEVGPLGILLGNRHLLGEGEVVVVGSRPVDQPDSHVLLACVRLHLHAVAEQAIDLTIGVVEGLAAAECRGLTEFKQHLGDDLVAVALARQPVGKQRFLDVAVAGAIFPVTEVGVAKRRLEERHHPSLRADFPFADRAHGFAFPRIKNATSPFGCRVSIFYVFTIPRA